MSTVEAGILASNFARLALMNAAIRPDKRLETLYDILTKLGYFVKRGEVYVRTGKLPPERGDTIVAKVVDEIIVPYLLGRPVDLKPSLLHSFTYIFQGLRIRVATEILPWGGFTLVAGFLPCGFSSELSAQAGRDLVLSEDLQDVLDIESERLSVLPIMSSPLSSYLAPAAFIALEPSTDLQFIKSKYGIFDTVIICHRPIDFSVVKKIGSEIIFIYINGVLGELASLINKALGLEEPPQCGEVVNKMGGQIIHNDEDMCIISSRG
ncbi:MAG: hypothetical protein ABWJ97_05915 [Thermoproteus sp.]